LTKISNPLVSLPFYNLDDDDFRLALFELENGSITFDPNRLASLKFNPLLGEIKTFLISLLNWINLLIASRKKTSPSFF